MNGASVGGHTQNPALPTGLAQRPRKCAPRATSSDPARVDTSGSSRARAILRPDVSDGFPDTPEG